MSNSLLSGIVRGTLATATGKITTVVLSFVTVAILARLLEPEEYGGFILLRVFALFLAQLSGFGLDVALPIILSRIQEVDEKRKMVNTVLSFRAFMVILFSLLALTFRKEIAGILGAALLPPELAIYLPIMILCEAIYVLTQSTLQSFFQFRQMGRNDMILSVSNFILMLFFIIVLKRGADGLVFARVLAQVFAVGQGIRAIPIEKKLEFYWDKIQFALRFSLPLLLNSILTFMFTRVDTLVVGSLLGTGGVAYYEVGRRIPDNLRMLYDAFVNVYFPFISKMYSDKEFARLENFINTILRFVAFATASVVLLAALSGYEVIRIVFTEAYLPTVPVFILSTLLLSLRLIGSVLGYSVVGIGDTGKPSITSAIYTVVSLVSNLLLIPVMGISGAAVASIIGVLVSTPIDFFFVWRKLPGIHSISFVKPQIILGGFIIIGVFVNSNNPIVWALIWFCYLIANVLFRVVTPAEINELKERGPRFVQDNLKRLMGRRAAQA